jgi:membrane fusion protein, multidrug efflux system
VLFVIDNQINAATATLKLKCKVPNPNRRLWPNQFVKARLLIETKKDATVIPSAAVQRGPNGTFVYLAGADGKAQQRMVDVGLTVGEEAIVDKGLEPGEKIVVEGQAQLRPGSTLQAHGDATPAHGDATPAHGDATPAHGDATHAHGARK